MIVSDESPMPFDKLTKIKGDHTRHIEQLWDEIKKLKERVKDLESTVEYLNKENDELYGIND